MMQRSLSDQRLITALGCAGLLPMLACVLLFDWVWSLSLLTGYSLAIIAFLAGSWWSTALMQRRAAPRAVRLTLISSNLIVIVAVAAATFLDSAALLVLALLYACLLFGEQVLPQFRQQPGYYRRMRVGITSVVIVLHVTAFLLVP